MIPLTSYAQRTAIPVLQAQKGGTGIRIPTEQGLGISPIGALDPFCALCPELFIPMYPYIDQNSEVPTCSNDINNQAVRPVAGTPPIVTMNIVRLQNTF